MNNEDNRKIYGTGLGLFLVKHLVEAGASVVVSDVDVDAVGKVVRDFGVDTAEPEKIHAQDCDIFAPSNEPIAPLAVVMRKQLRG